MNNKVSNSPSFGMALYAPTKKKVARVLGNEIATEFEKVRPTLAKIAEDVDIYVKPDKAWFEMDHPDCDGFMLYAGKFKSKLDAHMKLLKKLFIEPYRPDSGYAWARTNDVSTLGESLIAKAQKIVSEI